MKSDIHSKLLDCIARADRYEAGRLTDAWIEAHGFEKVLLDVAAPVLRNVGELWQTGEEFSLAQAYVASKVVEDILEKYAQSRNNDSFQVGTKGPVVVGNIRDDLHELGRKIVISFLKADGWIVYDLGVDVEPERFLDEAAERGARVIGVSAMMYTAAEHIQSIRQAIDHRGLTGSVQLAVGGAVFRLRPELAAEVGADGMGMHAFDAGSLFERLWDRSLKMEGVHP